MTSKMKSDPWKHLVTESVNRASSDLDLFSPERISALILDEDLKALARVKPHVTLLAKAARFFARAITAGGRVLYCGAGTSGRMGVIDAAELVPTFGLPFSGRGSAVGIIAGGLKAMKRSVEGAEDDAAAGAAAIRKHRAGENDLLIGISASSLAPFVREALVEAKKRGAATVLVTMNKIEKPEYVDILIPAVVGAEVLSGSTRMKAGLATKAILHNISTTAMVLSGKVYGNRMVDLRTWCAKLESRGVRLISELGGVSESKAKRILTRCGGRVKLGIVMAKCECGAKDAEVLLKCAGGNLRKVMKMERAPQS